MNNQQWSFTDLLTIAIPVFERKNYFAETLESALNQTIKCEIIVVDNCSSHDFFEKICKEKAVTYYRNETNIGLFPNQNRCYELAKTEYVKILDDDDILSPNYVEAFVKARELHPDIDVFFSNYVLLTSKGEFPHPYILPFGYMERGDKIIEYGIKMRLGFPYMTSIIRKSKSKLELDPNISTGGYDWLWVYSNAYKLSFYGEIEKNHKYRIHDCKASDKYKIFNLLTVPFIYDKIFPKIISDQKMLKTISKKSFWELIRIKSHANNGEIKKIINTDNRFGKYLKEKLDHNITIKTIFFLPRIFSQVAILLLRILNWFSRQWRRSML